jgi:hypothetical protein
MKPELKVVRLGRERGGSEGEVMMIVFITCDVAFTGADLMSSGGSDVALVI